MAPQAAKDDRKDDKPRVDLIPASLIIEVGEILGFGASKYGADNWRQGINWRRLYGATLRHLLAWEQGEDFDGESNLPHLAHAACNLAFLIEYARLNLGEDDRWNPKT